MKYLSSAARQALKVYEYRWSDTVEIYQSGENLKWLLSFSRSKYAIYHINEFGELRLYSEKEKETHFDVRLWRTKINNLFERSQFYPMTRIRAANYLYQNLFYVDVLVSLLACRLPFIIISCFFLFPFSIIIGCDDFRLFLACFCHTEEIRTELSAHKSK